MIRVVGCIVDQHDLALVALAATLCVLAAVATVMLAKHAASAGGRVRAAWFAVAAITIASGAWTTHFIAMLAFSPGLATAFDLRLTVLSFVVAVAFTGAGAMLRTVRRSAATAWIGGAVGGAGISAMHYIGVSALQIEGQILWDRQLVAASVLIGMGLGGAALAALADGRSLPRQAASATLLVLAIGGLHFTGMGAITIVPDPTVVVPESALPKAWLAVAVALASVVILALAGAGLAMDLRERRRSQGESARLRSLANAAVEGLLVCDGETIVTANDSFAALVRRQPQDVPGTALAEYLPREGGRLHALDQPLETDLVRSDGSRIPVELIVRTIDYAARPHFAVAMRDLRARRRAERQIEYLAHHDALTGLANRASFDRRIGQEMQLASASGRKLAVLCLNLDRFKEVNDLFGHAAGDALLTMIARLVTGLLDETQLMARLSGDEFVVLVPCDHAATAGRLAERILESLRETARGTDGPKAATSIGIAVYPDDASDHNALLICADTAVYRAKQEGRGTYRFFEARMGAQVRERRLLEHDLRMAVDRGELELVYQPQTGGEAGAVVGFEALLRWNHPSRGSISPSVFIPIAEESGAILQVGEWVLREACREAARWRRPLSIAVNVSAVQIHAPNFLDLLVAILRETGLAPSRLEIEITETALIRDPSRALTVLRGVKELGVHIAMDDFGTGYSSLSNLRTFPFDKIKIDRSFISQIESNHQAAAIVRSVLGLGHGLQMRVIVEGVETQAELAFLEAENCRSLQGYLIGRPAAIETFSALTMGGTIAEERLVA